MTRLSRREMLRSSGVATALLAASQSNRLPLLADSPTSDSMATQLYKSLSDEQRAKICLPADHQRRKFISNWWYVHRDHRINNTFDPEQQELIQQIFDSLHSPQYQAAVNKQVKIDQYGREENAPSVGFFGTPEDDDFEFVYTGHHVTRRCNAHSDRGHGFGGSPIFYGHFPEEFNETQDHPGNPYWYQGKLFNKFVDSLDGAQQNKALLSADPRSEKPSLVILKAERTWPGLPCADLSSDQKSLLLDTMQDMLAMFRTDDVDSTLNTIKQQDMIDRLHVSYYDGKYDIGSDEVWDTWQIEGPDMVWYFRGQPHIHCYFHVKTSA